MNSVWPVTRFVKGLAGNDKNCHAGMALSLKIFLYFLKSRASKFSLFGIKDAFIEHNRNNREVNLKRFKREQCK